MQLQILDKYAEPVVVDKELARDRPAPVPMVIATIANGSMDDLSTLDGPNELSDDMVPASAGVNEAVTSDPRPMVDFPAQQPDTVCSLKNGVEILKKRMANSVQFRDEIKTHIVNLQKEQPNFAGRQHLSELRKRLREQRKRLKKRKASLQTLIDLLDDQHFKKQVRK